MAAPGVTPLATSARPPWRLGQTATETAANVNAVTSERLTDFSEAERQSIDCLDSKWREAETDDKPIPDCGRRADCSASAV
jgi:hypothetical protein